MTEMIKMDFFSKIKSSLWGPVLYSILTGFFGSLLMVLFLTGLMPLGETVRYLPWILAFNGSVAGYTLLDRSRDRLPSPKMSSAGIGALDAVLVCILLNILTIKMTGMGLIGAVEMLLFIIIAAIFGGVGGWLAIKYASIKNS